MNELVAAADEMAAQGDSDLALRFAHLAALQTWVADVGHELRTTVLATAERVSPSPAEPLLLSVYSLTDPIGHNTVLIERAGNLVPHDVDADTAHLVGTALNLAGAFALSAPFTASASVALRAEGRLRQLAIVSAQQAWQRLSALGLGDRTSDRGRDAPPRTRDGQPLWEASALIVQGILAGVRGEFEQAESQISAAEAIALPLGAHAMLCGIQLSRGLTAIGAGATTRRSTAAAPPVRPS